MGMARLVLGERQAPACLLDVGERTKRFDLLPAVRAGGEVDPVKHMWQ